MLIARILAEYARNICGPDKDRAFTLGASDIGQCGRKVFFSKHGGERNPEYVDSWGATLRGQMIEQVFWVPALRARFGANLKFIGDRQRQFKRGFISATPDALLTNAQRDILAPLGVPDIGSDCLLLECKSVDPRVKLDAPKPEHRYQAIVQLGVVRETTEFQPRFGVLAYINTSFWDDITEFAIGFDLEIYAGAKVRATQVLTAHTASELPPDCRRQGMRALPVHQGLRHRAARRAERRRSRRSTVRCRNARARHHLQDAPEQR